MKFRRLATIAKWINENLAAHGFRAVVIPGYCNTDSHIAGTRFRRPGKGRYGSHLLVFRKSEAKEPGFITLNPYRISEPLAEGEWLVLSHNSAETYRKNSEVEDWLEKQMKDLGLK